MSRKSVRFKRKSNHKKGDKSTVISKNDEQATREGNLVQVDESSKSHKKKDKKSSKQVHVAFLPEKYQPLVEEEISAENNKKKDKCKKFRKNVGKTLRYTWKCLVVGLQNLSTAYSMPLGVAVTVVPDVYKERAHI